MSKVEAGKDTMPKHSIRVTLEGMDVEKGHVPFSVFVGTLERVASMLRRIDTKSADDNKASFYLRVVGLSHGSPATIDLEQCLVRKAPEDRREKVARKFIEVMEAIEAEVDGPHFDYDLLEKAEELTAPVGKQLKTLQVSTDGTRYDVDLSFRDRLLKKLAPEEHCIGAVRGMLEYLNIHGKKHAFRIYPDVGPDKVTCVFDDSILEQARTAIGRFVEVRGELKYKVVARFPHEIAVRELMILPDQGPANLLEARGMFPGLTGDLTTEEYIAQVREYGED